MTRWPLVFALLATAACGAPVAKRSSSTPSGTQKIEVSLPVEELDLPNGLHVIFHPVPTAAAALVYVRYEVGSKDDPVGRSGFAHLFEHLMFRGSKDTGARDYEQWLEEIGGVTNAFTKLDTTEYYALVPPSALPRAIWLESDRMAFPAGTLDEEGFTQERNVVKNESRERYENQSLGRLDTLARAAVFGDAHPYGRPPIGQMADLDAATLADVRAFAQKFYTPQNATLVIAGSYDPKTAKDLVQRYFGAIPAGAKRDVREVSIAKLTASSRIDVEANVDGPAVMVAWPAPAEHADATVELGMGLDLVRGKVEQRLVYEKRIAHGVEVRYARGELGGLVTVFARLNAGASTDAALTVIDDTVDTMSRVGSQYSFDALPTQKTLWLVQEVDTLQTLNGRAERLLDDLKWHGKVNAMQGDLQQIQAVDPADIGAAIERFLRRPPHVTIVVTPRADAPRAGRLVGAK